MILGTYKKQPSEIETIKIDWSARIDQIGTSGYAISSAQVSIFDSEGNDVTGSMLEGTPDNTDTEVLLTIKGGTSGAKYYARIRATLAKAGATTLLQEEDLPIVVAQVGS